MADEAAISLAGHMIHDLVDLLQEKILKDRKSRSEEHWRTLKDFWKICKAQNAGTSRLMARHRMCKILMKACSTGGYDIANRRALINWEHDDWESLMERLANLFETSKPFTNKWISEIYIACFQNMILAGDRRRILEDDIKHRRETVSLSAENQKEFQNHIRTLLKPVPDEPSNVIGVCMTSLHENIEDDGIHMKLLSPANLEDYFSNEPFLFDWVILKIEEAVKEYNIRKFNGQEAVLFQLSYELPSRFETGQNLVNEGNDEQACQGTPTHRTPEKYYSPVARQIDRSATRATPRSSQDGFLQEHKPVALGSVLRNVTENSHRAKPKTPTNVDRKRKNPDIFDEDGRARFRRKWTAEQTNAILAGLKKFADKPNKWHLILNEYPIMFEGRTSVMIKDRYRVLKEAGAVPPSLLQKLREKQE